MGILAEEFPSAEFGEAGDTGEAIQEATGKSWDAVILDVTMPGRGGLYVLSVVHERTPGVPVLVLSMHPEEQFAVRALKAGAAGYLTKSTAPDELVGALRRVLDGKRYVSESLAERLADLIGSPASDSPAHELLSDREFQVLCKLAGGQTPTQIADELSLSVKTVSTYRARVLDKMGLRTNVDLTRYALEHGLIQ